MIYLKNGPSSIKCDFELVFIRACEVVFPAGCVQGCLFHFMQSMWRHIQNTGLTTIYRTSSKHRFLLKLPLVSAFCPSDDVETLFNIIKKKLDPEDPILLK